MTAQTGKRLAALGHLAAVIKQRDLAQLAAARAVEAAARARIDLLDETARQVRSGQPLVADTFELAMGERVLERLRQHRAEANATLATARAVTLQRMEEARRSVGRSDVLGNLAQRAEDERKALRDRRDSAP